MMLPPWALCCPLGMMLAPWAWCCTLFMMLPPWTWCCPPWHDAAPWDIMLPPWAWCCPLGHYAAFLLSCACWSPIGMMLRPKNINSTLAPMDHYFVTEGFFLMRGVATCGSLFRHTISKIV
jgi:hypothetical protein